MVWESSYRLSLTKILWLTREAGIFKINSSWRRSFRQEWNISFLTILLEWSGDNNVISAKLRLRSVKNNIHDYVRKAGMQEEVDT